MVKQLGWVVLSCGLMLIMGDRLGAQPTAVIYVDPHRGNDQTADGTADKPYKTITSALSNHRHTRTATIKLAQGTYSTATGEVFPLVIPSEITVLGNEAQRGAGVIIQGGGHFRSLFLGQQNVAVVLQDRAALRGVTVTNNNPRGFGVWIEKGSPTVSHSTLIHNTQDGLSITGRTGGSVINNVLRSNGANAITVEQLASPEIRHNVIVGNGFGISIRQNSAPQIIGNQILRNRDGVIVQGQARPLLRSNQIRENGRSGLVVLGQAIPDLGTASYQGQNVFADNGERDIHNSGVYAIAVNGNQVDPAKTLGKLDFHAEKLAIAPSASIPSPVPPADSVVVSLHGTPPPVSGAILPHLPPIATTPPKGEPVNQPIIIAPPRPVVVNASPARWRLLVPVLSADTLPQVKEQFPDAFVSHRDGRSVVQVGAYSDRQIALQKLQQLTAMGLPAVLEPISR